MLVSGGSARGLTALACASWWWVVDYGPKEPEFSHRLDELVEIHRLNDVRVRARVVASHQILFLSRGGKHYHGDSLQVGVGLCPFEYLHPVHLGQLQVEQHDGRVFLLPRGVDPPTIEVI